MIEMVALILFVSVLVAMIAAPDRGPRTVQTEPATVAPAKPAVVQTV